MRTFIQALAFALTLSASTTVVAQQPQVVHAQLTTQTADHGLSMVLDELKRQNVPLWVGYSIPVVDKFSSGWRKDRIAYLEGAHPDQGENSTSTTRSFDHAVILLRMNGGAVVKLRVEDPGRQLDAGGLRFVWLTDVAPDDSVHALTPLATQPGERHLRDSAVFAISIHKTAAATQALVNMADAGNDLGLREKAAFWLVNQRGHDGLAAVQYFAHDDTDPKFREKLTFDLTLSKEPAALNELVRMAHEDASPQVRKQAQFWMATKGGKLVAGDLRNAAESDPNTQVRTSAVFALSRLPGDEAATQLIQVANNSKDPAVRRQAVFWLGQSNDPRALDYLTKLLRQ